MHKQQATSNNQQPTHKFVYLQPSLLTKEEGIFRYEFIVTP